MANIKSVLDSAITEVRRGDLIGESARQHASLTDQNGVDAVVTAFQSVLDQLVRSDATIIDEEGLEMIVQVVHTRGGGVRTKFDHAERGNFTKEIPPSVCASQQRQPALLCHQPH